MTDQLISDIISRNPELGYYVTILNDPSVSKSDKKIEVENMKREEDYKNLSLQDKNDINNYMQEIADKPIRRSRSRSRSPSNRQSNRRRLNNYNGGKTKKIKRINKKKTRRRKMRR